MFQKVKIVRVWLWGIAQIFLKLIAEKLVVFRGKMWAKMAKEWFHRKRAHIFFIFSHGIQ